MCVPKRTPARRQAVRHYFGSAPRLPLQDTQEAVATTAPACTAPCTSREVLIHLFWQKWCRMRHEEKPHIFHVSRALPRRAVRWRFEDGWIQRLEAVAAKSTLTATHAHRQAPGALAALFPRSLPEGYGAPAAPQQRRRLIIALPLHKVGEAEVRVALTRSTLRAGEHACNGEVEPL